jgi:hypothetical protein
MMIKLIDVLPPAGTRRVHPLRAWDNVRRKEILLGRANGSTSMVPPAALPVAKLLKKFDQNFL